jgi:hypothetical protein
VQNIHPSQPHPQQQQQHPPPHASSLQAVMNPLPPTMPGSVPGPLGMPGALGGPGGAPMPPMPGDMPYNNHHHSSQNQHVHMPRAPITNNPQFNYLNDPVNQAVVGDFAGMAQTSVEQDQLLSDFFGAPGQAGSETNLLATLWNHDVFDEFSDFLESTGVDMGMSRT